MYCDWPVLGRCCFCMPLRRGVLTFGYINIFFTAFVIGVYSYLIHYDNGFGFNMFISRLHLPAEICLTFYCFELIFGSLLIYGTHKKYLPYIKTFYYYTATTCVAEFIMSIIDICLTYQRYMTTAVEKTPIAFVYLCIQIYLLTLVRSLIVKLETTLQVYDNQLHQIVTEDMKFDGNRVYNDTTVLPDGF